MKNLTKTITRVVALPAIVALPLLTGAFVGAAPSPAFAITSCWQASDPIGCWLQCNLGGPCEIEWYGSVMNNRIEISLPNSKSDAYREVSKELKEKFGTKNSKGKMSNEWVVAKLNKKSTLVQTCSPEKLLAVIGKTQSPQKVYGACFKRK